MRFSSFIQKFYIKQYPDVVVGPTNPLKRLIEGIKEDAKTISDISDAMNSKVETAKDIAGNRLSVPMVY